DDQHCCRLGLEEPEAGPRALGSEDPVAFGLERRVQGGAVLRTLTHQEECGAARTGLPSAVHVPRAAPRHTAATGAVHVPRRARAGRATGEAGPGGLAPGPPASSASPTMARSPRS